MPAADLFSVVSSMSVVGAVGASDPRSSRIVYAMVIGLVAVGIGLILLAVWILRQTRPDLEVLAPLERMGDGDWKKRDPSTQRRMLDDVRPEGAQPLASEPPPPPIDADFEQADHPVTSFSDLAPGADDEVLGADPSSDDDSVETDDPSSDDDEVETDDPSSADDPHSDSTPVGLVAEPGDDGESGDDAESGDEAEISVDAPAGDTPPEDRS